jgi:tetratricopeptide (TPR) repeat protein
LKLRLLKLNKTKLILRKAEDKMKKFVLVLGALLALNAFAKNPTNKKPPVSSDTKEVAAAKELSRKAEQLMNLAAEEKDPKKADELRKNACTKWVEAYDKGYRPEDQLALGFCYGTRKQYAEAEAALRIFLALTPANHPDRITAEQSLAYVLRAQEVEAAKYPKAVVIKEPVSVVMKEPLSVLLVSSATEKPTTRWNRKALIVGSMSGGLALIASIVAVSLISAQEETGTTENSGIFIEGQP